MVYGVLVSWQSQWSPQYFLFSCFPEVVQRHESGEVVGKSSVLSGNVVGSMCVNPAGNAARGRIPTNILVGGDINGNVSTNIWGGNVVEYELQHPLMLTSMKKKSWT